jgi:hypothetical protein
MPEAHENFISYPRARLMALKREDCHEIYIFRTAVKNMNKVVRLPAKSPSS